MKKKFIYIIAILLIIATLGAFGRIADNDFINFDDPVYITQNNHVQSGFNRDSLRWAATAVVCSNWHPLTLLSHMLDWKLFGANAYGHHLMSVLLHTGAVVLLFLFLNKATGHLWASAFAASFFALHPLRVESVAWAAERKDVLSMFFAMATLYAYAVYAENSKVSKYILCMILFGMALMSKPMLVTLPFVLMLLDYWPLKRWQNTLSAPSEHRFKFTGRLLVEKIPFFMLSLASVIATIMAQNKAGSIASLERIPFMERLFNAIISYTAYLGYIFWPADLAVFYPFNFFVPLWKVLLSGMILLCITMVVLSSIRKAPFLFTGWFWYLGTLVPVIGMVQVGNQAMADRYAYLPSIGIAIIVAWGVSHFYQRNNLHKKTVFLAALIVLCLLTIMTFLQCGHWKGSSYLFRHALNVTKNNYLAHNHYGASLSEQGKIDESIDHWNQAINIAPYYADAYYNRGTYYGIRGQYQPAIESLSEAIRLKPDFSAAYNNRAVIHINHGNFISGWDDAQKACELGSCNILEASRRFKNLYR